MNISRRSFLAGFTAAAAAPAAFAKLKSDPDLAVLLSDVHVNGVEGKDMFLNTTSHQKVRKKAI